ncbi:porin family protein [Desulfovibrio sp. JY]|nr:porin family protein [Desulfovibrio sp. JY]
MNARLQKILVLFMAAMLGLAVLPARSFAIGEAGTFYVTPEFGVYGTSQKQVNSIITFGASGGYFIMDGLSIGAEALAYSFDQKKEGTNYRGYEKNPWAFGANALVRFYPVHTDKAAFFIGTGIGGLFSNDRIPYYRNGGQGQYSNPTLPVDVGFSVAMTQNVAFELVGRYQRIGFDDHGLDAWGGHAGIRITF